MLQKLPLEILSNCFSLLPFIDKVNLVQACQTFNQSFLITDFYDIDQKYLDRLTDDVLKNKWYIERLNVRDNKKVTKISHITGLKDLNCMGKSRVTDNEFVNMNLYKLNAHNNPTIKRIGHMTNLTYLNCTFDC